MSLSVLRPFCLCQNMPTDSKTESCSCFDFGVFVSIKVGGCRDSISPWCCCRNWTLAGDATLGSGRCKEEPACPRGAHSVVVCRSIETLALRPLAAWQSTVNRCHVTEVANPYEPCHTRPSKILKTSQDTLSRLLREKADPELGDREGMTPLSMAAAHGRVDVARALLTGRADVKTVDNKGRSALWTLACRWFGPGQTFCLSPPNC